jgi:hypothetical protein
MKIQCTVLRRDGTYRTVAVRPGKKDFELDKQKYNIKSFRIGHLFGIKILRAVYAEGFPDPIEFNIDEEMRKVNLKIDAKAIKNVTNKKILDVFGEAEFTKLEKLVILMTVCTLAVSAINLVLNALVLYRSGLMG